MKGSFRGLRSAAVAAALSSLLPAVIRTVAAADLPPDLPKVTSRPVPVLPLPAGRRRIEVRTAAGLVDAIENVRDGDAIFVADGTYRIGRPLVLARCQQGRAAWPWLRCRQPRRRSSARRCLIKGHSGGGRAAIFLWVRSRRLVVERNQILHCDRGILLGNPSGSSNYQEGMLHDYDSICRNNWRV